MSNESGIVYSENKKFIQNAPEPYYNVAGKTLASIGPSDCEEGVKLIFDDGTYLEIGYSTFEGRMLYGTTN